MEDLKLIDEDEDYCYYKSEVLGKPVYIKQHKKSKAISIDMDSIAECFGYKSMLDMMGSDEILDAMNYYKSIHGVWPKWDFIEKNN
jgi:hypothetical protein